VIVLRRIETAFLVVVPVAVFTFGVKGWVDYFIHAATS
jgi:hypothetical protein